MASFSGNDSGPKSVGVNYKKSNGQGMGENSIQVTTTNLKRYDFNFSPPQGFASAQLFAWTNKKFNTTDGGNNATNNNIMEVGTNFNFLGKNANNANSVFAFNNDPLQAVANNRVSGNPWNATFLQDINLYNSYRFLNWTATNNNDRETNWQDRTLLTESKQNETFRIAGKQSPLAWEWIIDLMKNTTGQKDMWINIPHQTVGVNSSGNLVQNEYAHKLAILLKHGVDMKSVNLKSALNISDYCELANLSTQQFKNAAGANSNTTAPLNSNVKIYVEYSNEVWNRGFTQTTYAQNEGFNKMFNKFKLNLIEDNSGPQTHRKEVAMQKFSAFGHINTWQAFHDVFGYNSDRIIKAMGHQATESGYYLGRKAEVFNDASLNPKGLMPDYIAIAPYFGQVQLPFFNEQGQFQFMGNKSLDGSDSRIWENRVGAQVKTIKNSIAELTVAVDKLITAGQSHFSGVEFIAYEGGQHITNNCQTANNDGRMQGAYTDYLSVLSSRLELFMNFTHAGIFTADGHSCWGTVTSNGNLNTPKRRAIQAFINGLPSNKSKNLENTTIQVYPNPFSNNLTLQTEKEEGIMSIVDMTGRVLLKQNIDGLNTTMDTKTLKPGYYLVKVEQAGTTQTQKIIKY